MESHLTVEEVDRRARRREINRLAAKRSRYKGQRRRETLIQEIQHLQSCKCALEGEMGSLVDERGSLVGVLRKYLQSCCDPLALTSSVRMLSFFHRLAALLNWSSADTPSTGSVAPTSLIATPSCNSSNLAPPSSPGRPLELEQCGHSFNRQCCTNITDCYSIM